MPFDTFFSSKNKFHYVRSDKYEETVIPEVNRILALPRYERGLEMAKLNVKASLKTLTLTEGHVRHRLQFLWSIKHHSIQRRVFNTRYADQKKMGIQVWNSNVK